MVLKKQVIAIIDEDFNTLISSRFFLATFIMFL